MFLYGTPNSIVENEVFCEVGQSSAVILIVVYNETLDTNGFVTRSYEEWHENYFPFLGIATIRRHFKKLVDLGILSKHSYGGVDRTSTWIVNYDHPLCVKLKNDPKEIIGLDGRVMPI